jgi:hypothetical protein
MLGDKEGLMEEVAGALTNLADTNEDNQEAIGKAGAVAPLIKLLGSGVPKSGQEEAAGTLMNLAASEANKAKMVSAGVLGPLLALLSTGTVATQEHAAGCLANLANGHDEHQTAIIKAGAIEPLLSLLSVTGGGEPGAPHGVAARASSALLLLCLRKDGADAAMRAGGVAKLTTALERGVSEAAGALMNLALHSADAQQAILTGGALPLLVEMLSAGTPAGQEEAAGAIMNLVTNAPHNQKPVADAGAVLPLVMLLSFGDTPTAKEQAAAALGNLALGNAPLRKAIVGAQACPPLDRDAQGRARRRRRLGHVAPRSSPRRWARRRAEDPSRRPIACASFSRATRRYKRSSSRRASCRSRRRSSSTRRVRRRPRASSASLTSASTT